METISVNDELQMFKQKAKSFGKQIHKIEKIGNGNMSAFSVFYSDENSTEIKEQFFWRHDIEKLLNIFEQEFKTKQSSL